MPRSPTRVPRWRAAFLRALARYGNVRMAAEAAGIDHTVAYMRRRGDADFASAWDRAKARAGERLRALGLKPLRSVPPGLSHEGEWSRARGDAGLVVHGGHGATPPRLQRPRRWGWSADKERVFLQTIADTCNISEAARAIGMTNPSIYQRRARDPLFRAAWDKALTNGMLSLEMKTIEACRYRLEGHAGAPCYVPGDAPPASLENAILLLSLHRRERAGTKRRGWTPAVASVEDTRAAILRKVAAIKAHRLVQPFAER